MGKREPVLTRNGGRYVAAVEREYTEAEWGALSAAERDEALYLPGEGLPKRYRDARLPQIEDERIRSLCTRFAENRDRRGGLFIYGPVGVGKTHLISATMAAMCVADQTFDMFPSGRFFETLRGHWKGKDEPEFWAERLRKDCVVLDDFNFAAWKDWQVDAVERLVSLLYDEGGDTVLCATSNHTWRDVLETSPLSVPIRSRLREMMYPVALTGEDRRKPWGV